MIKSNILSWWRLLSVSRCQYSSNYITSGASASTAFNSRFHSTSNDGSSASNADNDVVRQQGENRLKEKLSLSFPSASQIEVEDISGGCGSMYQIHVESVDFTGLNTVKQHQLVTKALRDDIKGMHGVRISTKVPIISN